MTTFTTTYLLNNSPFATGATPLFTDKGLRSLIPSSITYVCPQCGSAWAQRKVYNDGHFWTSTCNLCPQCGPGFLFLSYEPDVYVRHAPREVLERELALICLLPTPLHYLDATLKGTTFKP